MKNRIKGIILAVLIIGILLIPSIPVYADESWGYYLEFTVQDTSGTDRTNVPVILSSLIGSNLVNAGYIDSDGLDTNLKETTTAMEYLLSTTNGAMVIPNLAASQTRTYRLYMNDSPGQHGFPIIVGDEGYMTVVDADALELGDNFEIEVSGYVDTDAGADKNIVYKDGAFSLYISGASEITGTIYSTPTYPDYYTTTPNNTPSIFGVNYAGQSFTASASYDIVGVILNLGRVGAVSHTLSVSLYAEDGAGKPTGEVLASGSIDGSTIDTASFADYIIPMTQYSLSSGSKYVIVFSYVGGDVSNKINYGVRTSGAYAGGAKITSSNSGATWTVGATEDLYFKIQKRYTYSVVATGITSGEHIVKLNADGADLKLYVDAVLKDTESLGGASVIGNANNWVLFGGNSMTYVNYYKQTVSGTLIAHYQPASMITATTVPDLEGAAQNGTITWGSNSNLTITMLGIVPFTEYVSESGTDEVADTIKPAEMPDTWYSDITDIANLPFYETFNDKATEMGMPTQTLYVMMMLGTAVAVGLGVLVFTGSALVAILACGVTIAAGVNTGILSGWMMLIYFIFAVGILYLSRQN